jgi:hypothetical protein
MRNLQMSFKLGNWFGQVANRWDPCVFFGGLHIDFPRISPYDKHADEFVRQGFRV